ncbi:hypothetical protein DES40_0286 [Litorimonas taeanensis]|uniref:Secreted protein n=1 Tax=Litorimonas taeanensis TaxID=568099 RepID=A0A420WJ69_9PROT|nr:hypothetical protein [Litorimonas taeanensis]RKQ70979.1 hypothetical protein DES40_0286 [Litorimonas taeanensis]
MTKLRFGAAILGLSFAVASSLSASAQMSQAEIDAELMNSPSEAGVVNSEASCTAEGGDVMDLAAGKVCLIGIRDAASQSKFYDGKNLGVLKCSGNGAYANELLQPSGGYCRIFLEQKKVMPSREEVEAATRASMKAEDLEVPAAETTN